MITTKIIFDRKKQAKAKKDGTIEIRVIVDRKAYYISTGIRIRETEWKGGMVVNRVDASLLNSRLAIMYELVCKKVNDCIKNGTQINTEVIKAEVWATKDSLNDDPTFYQWVSRQIEILNLADGTVRHYRSLLSRLDEFGRILKWSDVTTENIYEFDAWLHQRKLPNGESITDAAVYKYHKCLKSLLNKALVFDKIMRNPYDRLKFKRGESENIEYLTEDEMKKIVNLKVPADTQIEVARDLFVFQMFTGLAYSDAQAFDFSQYKNVDGRWINSRERIKSGVPYISSLLPPVIKVLEKYGFQVPKIDNADYNHLLKMIGTMAGITTKMHTHLARHTFATYMLRQGVKVENLQRMLGHKNIRQTMRYAKVLAQSVHDDFDMVAAKMKE